MRTNRLTLPDKALATDDTLPVVTIHFPELIRVSRHKTGEPYFGVSGGNRFDAPGCLKGTPEFKCCYLGTTFDLALAESLLHDAVPVGGAFLIAKSELDTRWVHRFGSTLNVLDLTGPLLKRMNGHAGLTGSGNYKLTQKWALAVFNNPLQVDGFLYMSRHMTGQKALALFDRAKAKLTATGAAIAMAAAPELAAAIKIFNIKSI